MKKITFVLFGIFLSLTGYSQGFGCGGTFIDNGGPNANYLVNSNLTTTICPDNPGEQVTVTFASFATEPMYDGIYVYDGLSAGAPQISSGNPPGMNGLLSQPGAFWGTMIPGPFTSSSPDGCLTFVFNSDNSGTQAGWVANVTCDPGIFCVPPTDLEVSGTGNVLTIDWTQSDDTSNWEVVLLPCGSPAPLATDFGEQTDVHPINVFFPNDEICQDVYVRSVCDINSKSPWVLATHTADGPTMQFFAFIDSNLNGIFDEEELPFSLGNFQISINDNEPVYYFRPGGIVDIVAMPEDSFDVSFEIFPEFSQFYSVPEALENLEVPQAGQSQFTIPVTVLQPYADLEINLSAQTEPRAGSSYTNVIAVRNVGSAPADATLTFTKDPAISLALVSPGGTEQLTDTGFTIEFQQLAVFETFYYYVTLNVPAIPDVVLGQSLFNSVTIETTGDVYPINNSSSISQEVVASYDPNDIQEMRGPEIDVENFSQQDYLYYTIRFQNSGTAEAIDVRLENTLPATLDPTSLRMLSASHDYELVQNGNELIWNFNGINLPFGPETQIDTQGFVTYKVKLNQQPTVGQIVENTAEIYFDSNPAIVTNTFETLFVESLDLNSETFSNVVLYPNPARSMLFIAHNGFSLQSIQVYDVFGKNISIPTALTAMGSNLDVSGLCSGIYFLQITADSGKKIIRKLIVE